MNDIAFEDYIANQKKHGDNIIIQVPLGCDRNIIYNTMLKHSLVVSKNHFYVTNEKDSQNQNIIAYEELNKYYDENLNTIFFIDNIQIFTFYGSSLLKEAKNYNIFVFFLDVINIIQYVHKIIEEYHKKIVFLYPKNFCSYVDVDYSVKKTTIGLQQYYEYKKRFLEYQSMYEAEKIDVSIPDRLNGILNVYLDKAIPNFSSISVEFALQRAPKFKTIIVDLLINNKKRHLIKMIDGLEGIDSFVSVYEKLDNIAKLVIIKTKEPLSEKVKKIRALNHNNSPVSIITDFNMSDNLIPSNINTYHITDGGNLNDLITIFDLLKHRTLSGGNNSLSVVSHVSESIKGDMTINTQSEIIFSGRLIGAVAATKEVEKRGDNMYIKGKELYVVGEK